MCFRGLHVSGAVQTCHSIFQIAHHCAGDHRRTGRAKRAGATWEFKAAVFLRGISALLIATASQYQSTNGLNSRASNSSVLWQRLEQIPDPSSGLKQPRRLLCPNWTCIDFHQGPGLLALPCRREELSTATRRKVCRSLFLWVPAHWRCIWQG